MPADGSTPTSLGVYPGQQIYSESYHEDNMVYVMPVRHPFGKATFSTVWGDLAVIGRTETYEIRTFRIDGSLHGIVRRWVEEFKLPGADEDGKVWTVFDPDGRALGFVETPQDLSIFKIGADYVPGRVTDALDVETIQMWSLTRPD